MYQIRIHRNRIALLMVLLSLVFVSACATNGKTMSTKQQGLVFEAFYKTTYSDIAAVRKDPASTPAQKSLADKKEAVLQQMHPILTDFLKPVDVTKPKGDIVGYSLSDDKIKLLLGLIDQLAKLAITGGE